MRRIALAALLVAAAPFSVACGDSGSPDRPASPSVQAADDDGDGVPNAQDAAPTDASVGRDLVVTGEAELEKPSSGPADAGTVAGHRAPDGVGSTSDATFEFAGVVRPATARARIRAEQPGRRARLRINDHGEFTATLSGLRNGPNRFTVIGSAEGHKSWRYEVVILRR